MSIQIDQLIRSRRRTIGLVITQDARLIVRAPHWAKDHEIMRLIEEKRGWIDQKRELFRRRPAYIQKQFVEGEEFLFLGQQYRLRAVVDLSKAVVLDQDLMISQVVLRNAADHIKLWYKAQALAYVSDRVAYFAKLTGLTYKSVKVNDARTRWGSCAYNGALNFTWRLIMAPPRVVDYVVVHELMHIKQQNHSRRFWNEVQNLIPDYKQDEQWLKDNGHRLRF